MACGVGHKSQQLVYQCEEVGVFKRARLKIGKCLGCGLEGCVYASTRGRVVKVTRSRAETLLALWLAKRAPRDYVKHLPRIYRVARVTNACIPTEPATDFANEARETAQFIIVREDIPGDLYGEDVDDEDAESMAYDFNDAASSMQYVADGVFQKLGLSPANSRKRLAKWRAGIRPYGFLGDAARLVKIFEWGIRNGVRLADAHSNNVGLRANGDLVLRDMGFAITRPVKAGVPTIQGLKGVR